jgi:hypothetical protein
MLDLVPVRIVLSHQAARLTGAGAGFAISGTLGTVSSTIALMKIIGSQNNIGMTRTPDSCPVQTHCFVASITRCCCYWFRVAFYTNG